MTELEFLDSVISDAEHLEQLDSLFSGGSDVEIGNLGNLAGELLGDLNELMELFGGKVLQ